MMPNTLKRWSRLCFTALTLAWAGLLLVAPATVSHGQPPGAPSPTPATAQPPVSPGPMQKAQELVDQGKVTPEQARQATEALDKGTISPTEIQRLKEKQALGTLTPEEIAKGRKLLEQRERKAGPTGEQQPKPPEAEQKAEPAGEVLPAKPEVPEKPEFRIFGHELFSKPPSTFAPITQLPVSDEYVIGPGDEIKVLMWGRIDAE